MVVPLAWRRVRPGTPIPGRLVFASLAQLLVVLVAAGVLAGSGEITTC